MFTPLMQQYFEVKNKYKEFILMYRVGDFYEMFFDDAKIVSKELELVLTGKDCGEEERAPMCGVPFHAVEGYLGKLVAKGYKVAICEQIEDPATAKGLVKRDVIRMVSPGTLVEGSLLDEKKNNYICAIYFGEKIGVSFADISTGDISVTFIDGENKEARLLSELGTYQPKEAILNVSIDGAKNIVEFLRTRLDATINPNRADLYDTNETRRIVNNTWNSIPSDFNDDDTCVLSLGALIAYLKEMHKQDLGNIGNLNYYLGGQYLELDLSARRNLELTESMRRAEKKGSLLDTIDRTKTAAGARLLKRYLDFPLRNPGAIEKRLDSVEELISKVVERKEIRSNLSSVLDLERLITRIVYGSANARDLRAIANTLSLIPSIKENLSKFECGELPLIYKEMDEVADVRDLIFDSIVEDPPFTIREGGIIKEGYNQNIDYLRSIMTNGKDLVSQIEEREKEATGIRTLKVGYNRVFGYYIEVSKSFINDVPETYIRKQTLSNCERYITEELKNMESQILGASDKLSALEYQVFTEIRNVLNENVHRIQKVASLLSKLDVYCSFAEIAENGNYVKPDVDYSDVIDIKDGRHPVVENSSDTLFVPNDTYLDTKNNKFMLITGPNMAGKSTYMRQVAIICILAQIGSFVPARYAHIGVVDKIFTRVGASDDLAMGKSTFMVEMSEVADILQNATKNSLIIYDEIGRGTSTFDGMSIAKSVAEYTISKKIGAKTLFATHYHELTTMENEYDGVVNYNIAAKKKRDDVVFLRKIVRGAADDSYGIEVAKLAGIPSEVVKRAREILSELENGEGTKEIAKFVNSNQNDDMLTMSFNDMGGNEIKERLEEVDINTLTPLEALNLIYELKKMIIS